MLLKYIGEFNPQKAHIFWYCYTNNTGFAVKKTVKLKKLVDVLKVTNNNKKKNLNLMTLLLMFHSDMIYIFEVIE